MRLRQIANCVDDVMSRAVDDVYAKSFETPSMQWLARLGDLPSRLADEMHAENADIQGERL